MYFVNCFFFFSIIGFLLETFIHIIIKKPYNSSILYGPWTTVYGIAFFIIHFIGKELQKFHFHKALEIFLFFIINMIVLTTLEFLSGELILMVSKVRYWNYVNLTWNVDGFICLEAALFWGIGSTFLYYFLYPKIENFLKNIPKWITILVSLLYAIDILFLLFKSFFH